MTAWGSRLPFSLDPLIAEAKRRMRRRRLATAAVVLLLAGGIAGVVAAVTGRPSSAHEPAFTPAANNLPPLSNLAARAVWCGDAYNASGHGGCHSPDGKWAIVVENHGRGCTLTVTSLRTGRHERIARTGPGSCAPDLWIGPNFIIQRDVYGSTGRVVGLDPPSRKLTLLARFGTFVSSPNERWIVGQERSSNPFGAHMVAVISLATHSCRVVATTKGPDRYLSVDKSPWSMRPTTPGTPFNDPVSWRTVFRDGKKIRVVSGPGTGFTRNSRSVIVAKWESSSTAPYAIHKRLVKFNLSALHTPCPTGVAPRG
jgi:hypothetical protein